MSLALAAMVNIGFGLVAIYLVLLNGTIHVVQAGISRGYNPGLGTAITLFLPLGGYGIAAIRQAGGGSFSMHIDRCVSRHCYSCRNYRPRNAPTTGALTLSHTRPV